MPPIYNFDSNVFSEAAAYFTQKPVIATAFSKDAPKPEKGLFAARTPHDILSKIPMPRGEDHNTGPILLHMNVKQHELLHLIHVLKAIP